MATHIKVDGIEVGGNKKAATNKTTDKDTKVNIMSLFENKISAWIGLAIGTITIVSTILGVGVYIGNATTKIEERLVSMDKRFDDNKATLDKRFDDLRDTNKASMDKRFDDLRDTNSKQFVLVAKMNDDTKSSIEKRLDRIDAKLDIKNK